MGDGQDNKLNFSNSLNNASMLNMDRPTTGSSVLPPPTTIPATIIPQTPALQPTRNPPPISRPTRAYNPYPAGVNLSYPYSSMTPYNSMMDSGGYGNYGRFSMSPYGMYGGGSYGPYGLDSRFTQLAEESALPAFQSVESFVRSFTSVTMMMENTYQAMLMSFRAVLRVTESVSQLKKVLVDMMAALSVFKLFFWFLKRIKYFLGLVRGKSVDTLAESTWESLAQESLAPRTSGTTSWPLITFLGIMFGGPFIIQKMISPNAADATSPVSSNFSPNSWTPATVRFDFDASSPGELSIRRGDRLLVSTNDLKTNAAGPGTRLQPSWVLAINAMTKQQGYVPSDRISFKNQ